MLSTNGSERKNAMMTPRSASTTISRGSSDSGVATFGVTSRAAAGMASSMLFTEADLLCSDMAEQPGRPDEKHDDEHAEPDGVFSAGSM